MGKHVDHDRPLSRGGQDGLDGYLRTLTASDIISSCAHRFTPCALVFDKPILAQAIILVVGFS